MINVSFRCFVGVWALVVLGCCWVGCVPLWCPCPFHFDIFEVFRKRFAVEIVDGLATLGKSTVQEEGERSAITGGSGALSRARNNAPGKADERPRTARTGTWRRHRSRLPKGRSGGAGLASSERGACSISSRRATSPRAQCSRPRASLFRRAAG